MEENNQTPLTPVQSSPPEQNIPAPPPVQKPKLKLPIIISGIVLFLILIGTASAVFLFVSKPKQAACTMEAKICPDGTSVSRTGPNCEFSPCPLSSNVDETANWKTYTNPVYNYSLRVPNDWVVDFEISKQYQNQLIYMRSNDMKRVEEDQKSHIISGSDFSIMINDVVVSYEELIEANRPYEKWYSDGKEITIDGKRAMLWTSNNDFGIPGQNGYELALFHNGVGYVIGMSSALPQEPLFEQILSTFRFD